MQSSDSLCFMMLINSLLFSYNSNSLMQSMRMQIYLLELQKGQVPWIHIELH